MHWLMAFSAYVGDSANNMLVWLLVSNGVV